MPGLPADRARYLLTRQVHVMPLDISKILPLPKVKVQRCPCLDRRPTVHGLGVCRRCLDAWWKRCRDLPIEERLDDDPIPHRVLKPTAPKPPTCNHNADPFEVVPDYHARCARCGTTKGERMAQAVRAAVGARTRT